MTDRIVFRLRRWWPPDVPREEQFDCYEAIKAGRKTSEWREAKDYWLDRLFEEGGDGVLRQKVSRAWFTVGMPKNNLPRLEADIKDIVLHGGDWPEQIEVQIENVIEVVE